MGSSVVMETGVQKLLALFLTSWVILSPLFPFEFGFLKEA